MKTLTAVKINEANWFSIQSNGKRKRKRKERPAHLLFDEVHVCILEIESIDAARSTLRSEHVGSWSTWGVDY